MLYFSKLKLITIYFIIILLSIFTSFNFINIKEKSFFDKKINLGLDLQGGSYLLLEVDSQPLIKQKLQNKLLNLRKSLKKQNIKYKNLKINNNSIIFNISEDQIGKFVNYFLDKDNPINIYYNNYRLLNNFLLKGYVIH